MNSRSGSYERSTLERVSRPLKRPLISVVVDRSRFHPLSHASGAQQTRLGDTLRHQQRSIMSTVPTMITEGSPPSFWYDTVSVTDTRPLFADEASLYDRQIRLWGLEAQNR